MLFDYASFAFVMCRRLRAWYFAISSLSINIISYGLFLHWTLTLPLPWCHWFRIDAADVFHYAFADYVIDYWCQPWLPITGCFAIIDIWLLMLSFLIFILHWCHMPDYHWYWLCVNIIISQHYVFDITIDLRHWLLPRRFQMPRFHFDWCRHRFDAHTLITWLLIIILFSLILLILLQNY